MGATRRERTRPVDPLVDGLYRRLLDRHVSRLFHSPPWLHVLRDAYGFRPQALLLLGPDGEPEGGVVACRIADAMGARVVSLPFSDYCDPLVESCEDWETLFDALRSGGERVIVRCVHSTVTAADARLAVLKTARWHGLSLLPDLSALWRGLEPPKRRAIRRARRQGVELAALEGDAFLDAFYRLHLGVRKHKYRLLPQPRRFFDAIRRRFEEANAWYPLAARCGGRIVAAVILLRWGGTLYYKFSASDPAALDLRPNDFLMWRAIEFAAELGCAQLDLGLSDDDQSGLVRFKRQFGAEEKEIRFLCHDPGGAGADAAVEFRAALGRITQFLTDRAVPDEVTSAAGDRLYRYFA